ncbi:hypothetical protein CTI12_AA248890 [Artemisia annua]|uniref:Cytochrome P450 n=1 Tax=Artemisia annua TaxID=35608 RepID=A0A2U1NMK1_ARTAN|nr:hypothetical protein CTI12_AA248890 [Artemisia annua]
MPNFMDFLSNPFFISVIVPLSILVFVLCIYKQQHGKNMKKYHPTAGTVFDLFMNLDRLHHYMTDLAEKYKTYRLINLFHGEVHTSDPANVEYILKTNFKNYGKGKHNHSVMEDLLGDGIFTVDGELWRQQRKQACFLNRSDQQIGEEPIDVALVGYIRGFHTKHISSTDAQILDQDKSIAETCFNLAAYSYHKA